MHLVLSRLDSAAPLLGTVSENVGPTFFLSLIGVCFLMIIAGAVGDHLAVKIAKRRAQEEKDKEKEGAEGEAAPKVDKKKLAKERKEKLRLAKQEAKARKKEEKTGKKSGKKGATAPEEPAAENEEASHEETRPPEESADEHHAADHEEHLSEEHAPHPVDEHAAPDFDLAGESMFEEPHEPTEEKHS